MGSVYEVKVTLESSEDLENVRIGMTGDAKFILKKRSDVLFVPPDFVNSDKTGKFVSVGDKKNKVYVEVGFENEEQVEIAGDIKEGDIVVD